MEMCTAESGRMESLSRASSPGMVNLGMEVRKMWKMDYKLVHKFMKKYYIHASPHMKDDFLPICVCIIYSSMWISA
jgi:hypothetical protein